MICDLAFNISQLEDGFINPYKVWYQIMFWSTIKICHNDFIFLLSIFEAMIKVIDLSWYPVTDLI